MGSFGLMCPSLHIHLLCKGHTLLTWQQRRGTAHIRAITYLSFSANKELWINMDTKYPDQEDMDVLQAREYSISLWQDSQNTLENASVSFVTVCMCVSAPLRCYVIIKHDVPAYAHNGNVGLANFPCTTKTSLFIGGYRKTSFGRSLAFEGHRIQKWLEQQQGQMF